MAAPATERTVPSTSLLKNESTSSRTSSGRTQNLPDGPCNFRNLSVGGVDPPRCGCQRFWDKLEYTRTPFGKQNGVVGRGQAGWCMCDHHACFHEISKCQTSGVRSVVAAKTPRSSSQLSRTGDLSLPSHIPSQSSDHDIHPHTQGPILNATCPAGGPIWSEDLQSEGHMTESAMPDTARASHQEESDSVATALPPIPSQCILPPEISPGRFSGHSQSFQSFPGVNSCQLVKASREGSSAQLSQVVQFISASSEDLALHQQSIRVSGQDESFMESVTDIVTPSPRDSLDLETHNKFHRQVPSIQAIDVSAFNGKGSLRNPPQSVEGDSYTGSTSGNATAMTVRYATESEHPETSHEETHGALKGRYLTHHLQMMRKYMSAHPMLSTRVDNHEQRLDLLENISSSFAGAQEVQEKFDLADERVGEVESRVEELEKSQAAMNDMSSFTSRHRRLRHFDDGDGSMISQTSTDMISAAIERTEFAARLDTIECQLNDVHASALPSFIRPWKVEVVFLPFGSELKGIWSTVAHFPGQRSRQNSMAADGRTQTQETSGARSSSGTSSHSNDHESWQQVFQESENIDEWLVARASRQGTKVEERLRSRGLVKMIEVKGPSSRDVHAAILATFGHLPMIAPQLGETKNSQIPDSLGSFHGLQAPWIPLRKLHKDSRLRFLDPSEMVTSALWNVMFLSSSVVMRATGVRRLYITQRESYIQQPDITDNAWAWQTLRVLPRVFPDVNSSAEVREADALEACWEWDEKLDPPLSVVSFTSQHSSLSIREARKKHSESSQSGSASPDIDPILSTTPTSARPISPLLERRRPIHMRTTSMPSLIPLKFSPSQGKRRITSFDHDRNGPTSPQSSPIRSAASLAIKRQRISRSPSRPRDTPRWSVGPPSPYYHEEHIEQKRGTTPFAYATPHSNVPYTDYRAQSLGPIAFDDHDDRGSTTDNISMNGEDDDVEDFDSDVDQEHQPEDDIWEGVGDEMADEESDQEQKALSLDDDDHASSDFGSQPSEYPSTQPSGMYTGNRGTFRIHVDKDEIQDPRHRPLHP